MCAGRGEDQINKDDKMAQRLVLLGSYTFGRVDQDQEKNANVLRTPIEKKGWMVGEQTHE